MKPRGGEVKYHYSENMAANSLPLRGLRVLDFSRALAGPYCTLLLADQGAEVIKIEPPQGDESRAWAPPHVRAGEAAVSSYFLGVNRNKRSLALDLGRPEGRDVARRLAARADVLVENFSPGVMARLELDEARLRPLNPGLIYCSITAFGQTGDWSRWKGYDLIVQAVSGLMEMTGFPDGPPTKVGIAIADLAGGLHAAVGILAALQARRDSSGPQPAAAGRRLDVALLDSIFGMMGTLAPAVLASGFKPPRLGNVHAQITPYQEFAAADGRIVIAASNQDLWRRLCLALDCADWGESYAGNEARCRDRDTVTARLGEILRQRPAAEWLEKLRAAGVPAAPVMPLSEVLRQPHVRQREMIQTLEHPELGAFQTVASPLARGNTPDQPPPRLGEHGREILSELGLSREAIDALRAAGILLEPAAPAGKEI